MPARLTWREVLSIEFKDEPIDVDEAEDRETASGEGNGGSTRVDGLLSKTVPSVNTLWGKN